MRSDNLVSLRAKRSNQSFWDSLPVDCHEASASRNDKMFRFAQHDNEYFLHVLFCVIASVSEAINRVGILFGIPCLLVATLALLARNDPPPNPLRKGGGRIPQ